MTAEHHGPVRTQNHLGRALHPSPSVIKEAMGEVDGFNAKFAVLITRLVGTMWCAYLFGVIALIGLGPALKPGGEGIIAWIAQTFLQLVLLSVIMVGQNVHLQRRRDDSRPSRPAHAGRPEGDPRPSRRNRSARDGGGERARRPARTFERGQVTR
jgi:hypothetical protein